MKKKMIKNVYVPAEYCGEKFRGKDYPVRFGKATIVIKDHSINMDMRMFFTKYEVDKISEESMLEGLKPLLDTLVAMRSDFIDRRTGKKEETE